MNHFVLITEIKYMNMTIKIMFYNIIYRIVSKTLSNKLKVFIDKCVAEEQSAFIQGPSIIDNALMATEIIHYLKWKWKGGRM